MSKPATIINLVRKRLAHAALEFNRFTHRSMGAIRTGSAILSVLAFIASVGFIACVIIHTGYDHTPEEKAGLWRVIRIIEGIFALRVLYELIFRFRHTVNTSRPFKWVVDIALLTTLLPWMYPRSEHPWIPALDTLLYSNYFLLSAIGAYAGVTFCYGVMQSVGKRTNPSLLLSGSFLVFIFIGTLLLMLPKSTYTGISFADALFVSTSAVCITGLTPVDISVTLTPMGNIILAILVQIGALGVMTFTSFFALFFSGGASIYNQLLLRDMFYSKSMNALVPTLLYILAFTITVELAGAVAIYLSVEGTLGASADEEICFALFHSLSSFCNAGFSILPDGMSNPLLLYGNTSIYWITTVLIIAGAIGFPILVNFKDAVFNRAHRLRDRLRNRECEMKNVHPYDMNTKIVLTTFFALFVIGTAAFWLLENNNSLAGMSVFEKLTQSAFNSATPRSAGFSSIQPSGFLNVTIFMLLVLMWIGGASQSTAGGIKVNTFAAILLNLRAIITGKSKAVAFRRTVSVFSIRRANAVVALSILSYVFYSITLLLLEPGLSTRDLLFESCSALFTVGSSLGVTSSLSDSSLILLSTAMFLGRVGIISLLVGLAGRRHDSTAAFPSDSIIIN